MPVVIVYGTELCPDCIRSKRLLARLGIDYEWLDLNTRPELADVVIQHNIDLGLGPKRRIPLILIDGRALSEPSDAELAEALGLSAE